MTVNRNNLRELSSMDTGSCRRNRSVQSQDYELLLEDCINLYEELESAMDSIELLISEMTLAAEDIRDSFEDIEQSMAACTRRLRGLNREEAHRKASFQGSFDIPVPEADREETIVETPKEGVFPLETLQCSPLCPRAGYLRARGPEGRADGASY